MTLALSTFQSWSETAQQVGLSDTQTAAAFATLAEHYSEPHRAYHNLHHISRMLETVIPFQQTTHDYPVLCLALWFHDAVYDTRQSNNEEQSAALMASVLRPALTESALERVQGLILATKTHQTDPEDTDCQLLLDADLAILGSDPAEYESYAQAIRQEYNWVSEPDYRAGRRRVLEHFLARPQLYVTPTLFTVLEQPARDNLRWEIERL